MIDTDETPIDVTPEADEDGGDDNSTHVHVGIVTADGHHLGGSATAYDETTADDIAALIVRAALGAAAAHGTDSWIALQQLLAPTAPR
ncbi:hypothetical protein SK571_13585 [Lentzea sp. BCCO 10_0798]|uniref:Uncharacterized protein n=1 Tax=Lentzea kristufekii TaxID=3095430 RepID=A0ABU4TQ46_9PSEU|nr:hypothetical protein [Lentzea sp. BCCO 10_0798]MDX8050418.1 hypothetical protein [Lentzea sp. BCCO 10_0798]